MPSCCHLVLPASLLFLTVISTPDPHHEGGHRDQPVVGTKHPGKGGHSIKGIMCAWGWFRVPCLFATVCRCSSADEGEYRAWAVYRGAPRSGMRGHAVHISGLMTCSKPAPAVIKEIQPYTQ